MSATNTLSARLIGAIFLERGLVTEQQLQAALALQVETKEHLGEILVQHFGVSRIELASVLAEQWADLERANAGQADTPESNASEPAAIRAPDEGGSSASGGRNGERSETEHVTEDGSEPEPPRPLGAIFVEQGLVTDEELDQALERQRNGGEKLGEILVAQGSITRLQLASALAEQWTALRKIRPPSATEPQSSVQPAVTKEMPPADIERLHEAVAALEQRLRAAESVATREPWREEIGTATEGLQSSVTEIQAKLAETATREELEAVAGIRAALEELTSRVETIAEAEHANDPELVRRVETAAEAATAARSSLDGAFESLSLRLADVEARVHDRSDISKLQSELTGLVESVSELAGGPDNSEVEELRGEVQRLLDEVTRRSTATSEPDPALAKRVEKLTVQVDEIGTAIKGLDGGKKSSGDTTALREALAAVAARVKELETGGNKDLQDMRRSLSELEARVPLDSPLAERLSHYGTAHDEINALQERVDEVERHAAEVAERSPELEEHIHTLVARIQALEASAVQDELDALRRSVDALAERPVSDPTLPERVEQIGAQLDAAVASTQVEDLRAQVQSLAAETSSLGGIAAEVDAVRSELGTLDEMRTRLLAVEAGGASVEDLRETVAALEARPVADPDVVEQLSRRVKEGRSSVEDLRTTVAALEDRPVTDPDLVEQLSRRVEDASRAGREIEALREALTSLGQRLDSIAERAAETVPAEQITALADRLEALEGLGVHDGLAQLRRDIGELAVRPSGDAALAARVDELALALEVTAGVNPQLEALGARVGELARKAGAVGGVEKEVEELRSQLDALAQRDTQLVDQLVTGLEALDGTHEAVADLRRRLEDLADRPTADAARVEQLARKIDELSGLSGQIDALRDRLDVLSTDLVAPAEDLSSLRADLAALGHRFDSFGDRGGDAVPGVDIEALTSRLDALEGAASATDEVAALREQLAALAERPAVDPDLAERVARLAGALDENVVARSQLTELGSRLDALEKQAGAELPDEHGPRIAHLERSLEASESRDAVLESRFEDVASRLAAVDELPARIDQLGEQLSSHQSGHGKSAKKADLTTLRNDLTEQFVMMEQRIKDLAAGARKDHESLEEKVEKIVASVTDEIGGKRRKVDERMTAVEHDARALHSEIAEVRGATADSEAWRATVEAGLERRVDELGRLLEPPPPPADLSPALESVQAELKALAARIDSTDSTTTGAIETLRAQLEDRLDAEAGRTGEQVRAAEEALRAGLSSLGERLVETESTYLQAGDALRQSIERLEAAMAVDDDTPTGETVEARDAEPESEPERGRIQDGPFLAFVPNGGGYSLQELNGFAPVIGESVPVADRDGEFVVTRIGRSPLPRDGRRCAYLELRPGTLATADRVP